MIKEKYYIIAIVVLIGLGVGKHFYDRGQYNELIDDVKKDLEKEKDIALEKQQGFISEQQKQINNLIQQNEKAKADSKYWYEQAKKRSVNPYYDIDFITAFGIISNSNYKPGE